MSEKQPLKNFVSDELKLCVDLDWEPLVYLVDTNKLMNFARFYGFSKVRIRSMSTFCSTERPSTEVFSITRSCSRYKTPLKARWHEIEIYINEKSIVLTDREPGSIMGTSQKLNKLICDQIRYEASCTLSQFSPKEGIRYDASLFLILSTIAYQLPKISEEITDDNAFLAVSLVLLAKVLISNVSLAIEHFDSRGIRPSLLDCLELERLVLAFSSKKIHSFVQPHIDVH